MKVSMSVMRIKGTKYYESEYLKCFEYYKRNGKNTQVLRKYFQAFIENDLKSCFSRCVRLSKLPKRGVTLYRCLLINGKKAGVIQWNSYRQRQAYTNSQEYKDMTEEEFKEYNNARASTLKNFKKRYGECKGGELWENYCDRQKYTKSLQYYIEKYGNIKGVEEWDKVNRFKSNSLDSYIEKYGDEGVLKYTQYSENRTTNNVFSSKISQDLFDDVCVSISLPVDMKIYYQRLNKEFGVFNNVLKKYTYFDFVIPDLKICVEFNGDVFHANPEIYKSTDTPNPYDKSLTSEAIWLFDNIKNQELINRGYNIIIIWEKDYKNDKDYTTQMLAKEIMSDYEKYRDKINR